MRRRPGIAGIQQRTQTAATMQRLGAHANAERLQAMRAQLAEFKASLEKFALKHKAEIRADPAFRAQFHSMCASCGVDPLASNKGFWAETLGFGDFYAELGVPPPTEWYAALSSSAGAAQVADALDQSSGCLAAAADCGLGFAAGLGAGYDGLQRCNGTFTITATPNPAVSLDQLEAAIKAEIEKIAEQPPSEAEMDRVRAGVLAEQIYQRDSVMGQAMELGTLSVLGLDWRLAGQFDDNLEAVTPEQVQQAARKWLVAERSAVAHVIPEGEE